MERLHWLLDDVPEGGERVLFYSGHGAQIPSYNFAGEVDRLDECLVPFDFDWNPTHAIRDKQFAELYSQLGYDRRFVAIFDCCHSGGMTRDGGPRVRGLSPPDDVRHRSLRWNARLGMWQERKLPTPNPSLAKELRESRASGRNLSFDALTRAVATRLKTLRYEQTPALVGPPRIVKQAIPWARVKRREAA